MKEKGSETDWPRTLDEAVVRVIGNLDEKSKAELRKLKKSDLTVLHLMNIGLWIRNEFGLWKGNDELTKSCGFEPPIFDADMVSAVITEAVWRKLRQDKK